MKEINMNTIESAQCPFPLEAAILISVGDLCRCKSVAEAKQYVNHEARACKSALSRGYFGSDAKTFVVNACGFPVLTIGIWTNDISLWDLRTGKALPGFNSIPKQSELQSIVDHVTAGENHCPVCSQWHKTEDMRSFSFAGTVCKNCYNPAIHLPPDTRGD